MICFHVLFVYEQNGSVPGVQPALVNPVLKLGKPGVTLRDRLCKKDTVVFGESFNCGLFDFVRWKKE